MPKPRKNKQYWSEKQERLIKEFATCQNESRLTLIYQDLKPRLYIMAESVLYTFVKGFNYNDKELLIQDCIDHTLVAYRKNYNPEMSVKAFYYLGRVMKHRYFDMCTNIQYDAKAEFEENLTYIEDYPELHEILPDQLSEDETLKEAILRRFKEMLYLEIESHKPKSKNYKPAGKTIKQRRIMYMQYAIEFVEKYDKIDVVSLNAYIQRKMGILDKEISAISTHYFGFGCYPRIAESLSKFNTSKAKAQARNNSIIDTDFVPNTTKSVREQRKLVMKRKEINKYRFW